MFRPSPRVATHGLSDGCGRLTLKVIPGVRAPARQHTPKGGNQIGWYKRRSPDFTLTDVHSLVSASRVERMAVAPQDDVTQGDGSSAIRDRHAVPQQGGDDGAVRFQHSINDLNSAARHRRWNEWQSDERSWQRPEVANDAGKKASAHTSKCTYVRSKGRTRNADAAPLTRILNEALISNAGCGPARPQSRRTHRGYPAGGRR